MSYAVDFHKHQILFQGHLKGRQENSNSLPPSFFSASHWTSSEKDRFFHGLTLFSRLRPDLIAEHIKTKSIFDVCVYLHALQVATISRGHEPEASARETMEPALEMSERWVEHEEKMAAALTPINSCCWNIEYSEKQTPGNCCCGTSKIDVNSEDLSSTPSSQEEKQSYMDHLDSASLAVLASIIRESQIEDVDLERAITLEQGPGILPSAQPHSLEEEFQRMRSICNFYSLISSLDLTASSSIVLQSVPLKSTGSRPTLPSPAANPEPQGSRSELHEGIVKPTFTNNCHLRRLRKQLYMRRRRAEQVGKPPVPVSVKLFPGRTKRPRKPPKPRPKTYNSKRSFRLLGGGASTNQQPDSERSQPLTNHIEGLDESLFELRSHGGTTKPYRVKKVFQESGIDGQALSQMGFDMFHLSTLARLMR